eukprot:UN1684
MYSDGDVQHFTAEQVREMRLTNDDAMRRLGAGLNNGADVVVWRSAHLKLQAMSRDRDFLDCKLVCGGRKFPCHRIVLATASPVWRVALAGSFKESRDAVIVVTDADPSTVEALLKYVYDGTFDAAHAVAMLPLAHRYEMDELVGLCATAICDASIT